MSEQEYKIGKMKFSKEKYFEILQEVQDELKDLNLSVLVEWEQN